MLSIFKISIRNLLRNKRRSFLTVSLIIIGVVFVLVFDSLSGSFVKNIRGMITDSMLGHIQIHKKGYVESIENLPLNLSLQPEEFISVEKNLKKQKAIESFSPRIKFSGIFSNFVESTTIRLSAIHPKKEFITMPLLSSRIIKGKKQLEEGSIIVPELIAKGMKIGVGDTVVVVATNKDGSVNGAQFEVSGILESLLGPGGRDGYIHIKDAASLLRMDDGIEINEITIRLREFDNIKSFYKKMKKNLKGKFAGKSLADCEIHTWAQLTPFANIVKIVSLMTLVIRIMLMAIVLISILNVMIMAVYERIREIGTIAAMGTVPNKILSIFIIEGFTLGAVGAAAGIIAGISVILIINLMKIPFDFGRQTGLILSGTVSPWGLIEISIIVIIISVLASLQPALKASKMDPVQALRHI